MNSLVTAVHCRCPPCPGLIQAQDLGSGQPSPDYQRSLSHSPVQVPPSQQFWFHSEHSPHYLGILFWDLLKIQLSTCFISSFHSYLPCPLFFSLSSSGSATISFLGWNCKSRVIFCYCQCIVGICWHIYLVVVEEVHKYLHDTREDHQDGRGDEEDVDVVKWMILLFFGSCYKL